jgi:hypothetical protein
MVKSSRLVSTAMKARGVAKFPIPPTTRANQTKKEVTTSPSGVRRCVLKLYCP